ncbi:hypothetical protein KKH23_02955 [Patescibacteria group bacterium]|nr:hypothetical protein [Patescibacteria group bacterium]MBU0776681.1 hypothetical protein [Patescibacteria group bacterium]MBU0846125.1 hypothetical protein [Patescibacteria group bacterium]MBU0922786.1 hypothetical protein [Patescibacteria group bacterium]MBU1066303.1 hypothetical protein [Patescibacteria group bacterium]
MQDSTVVGVIGTTLVLIAYISNQTGKWKSQDFAYDLTNFIGSATLVIYAITIKSYPFAALNLVWSYISLKDVFVDFKNSRS